MFKTWDSARQLCHEINMTLATLDTQANQFLSKEHFWIGLHESGLSTALTAEPRYRWTGSCAPLTSEAAWDQQEPPGAGSTRMCVYARNETMKWRTDFCNTSHSFICERQTDFCFFNQTDFKACASAFKKPPKVFTVASDDECMELCEGLVLDGLSCWGSNAPHPSVFSTTTTSSRSATCPGPPACTSKLFSGLLYPWIRQGLPYQWTHSGLALWPHNTSRSRISRGQVFSCNQSDDSEQLHETERTSYVVTLSRGDHLIHGRRGDNSPPQRCAQTRLHPQSNHSGN
ncbi:uncharacterized protein LOC112554467 [Pomacea canaliculata]|uniref:uncharacterized protein LOC112554467 n=1 Tax=Pomacea canaliculata TaxID=400727 RepID=UPI000D736720|nr:uncharacterized protein LOC112554467 [Pomacea canaliculata]